MVTSATLVTMSTRWSIATAKAEFSRLVSEARSEPQVIENRGRAVAVVVSSEEYQRLAQGQDATARWRAVFDLSAEIREEGGAAISLPRRRPRRSPLPPERG
jgi:prevent-host-death family protein